MEATNCSGLGVTCRGGKLRCAIGPSTASPTLVPLPTPSCGRPVSPARRKQLVRVSSRSGRGGICQRSTEKLAVITASCPPGSRLVAFNRSSI